MKKSDKEIFQLRITLRDARPTIWRRVQVRQDMTLAQLHRVLQTVMGWENYHLHEFTIEGNTYGLPDPEFADERIVYDERGVRLGRVLPQAGITFEYLYDFGDCWYHDLVLEAVLPRDSEAEYPVCTAGQRRSPPEDVGGLSGYFDYLEAMGNRSHPEHEEMVAWRGTFDSEEFSPERANLLLRKGFRSRRRVGVSLTEIASVG